MNAWIWFTQKFHNWESTWALEALYVIAYETRILVERADRELGSNRITTEKLKGVGSFLMKVFRTKLRRLFTFSSAPVSDSPKIHYFWLTNTYLLTLLKSPSNIDLTSLLEKDQNVLELYR